MKLFETEEVELSAEELAAEIMHYDDMLSIESEIVDGMGAISNAEVSLNRLTKQLAIEEKIIESGTATADTLQMSTEMFNDICEDLGLEEMVLSTEATNLPSTEVDYGADMRKVNDGKKSLFSKIIEGIKKIFTKLWKKAKQLQAKILIVVGNGESKLKTSITRLKSNKYQYALSMPWDKLGQKAGFYYFISGKQWSVDLLASLMGDDEVMVMAANDIGILNNTKMISDFKAGDFNITSDSVLESKNVTGKITGSKEMMGALKGTKDLKDTLSKGKVTAVGGSVLTILNVVDDGNDDMLKRLASRKITTNTIRLNRGTEFKDPESYEKKDMIKFAEDILTTYKAFDKYTKLVDDYVKEGDKLLKEAGNNTVAELAGVMRTSLVIYNKLALSLSTSKRVEVVKMLNMLSGVVHAYAK